MTITVEKPYPLGPHIPIQPYKGVPPGIVQNTYNAVCITSALLEELFVLLFVFVCLHTFFLADQISCRSYVGSVYRMRSLAVSGFST